MLTVSDLKEYLEQIPDDYEVYIEDLRRIGPAGEQYMYKNHGYDDQDFIDASPCHLTDHNNKIFCICHHI